MTLSGTARAKPAERFASVRHLVRHEVELERRWRTNRGRVATLPLQRCSPHEKIIEAACASLSFDGEWIVVTGERPPMQVWSGGPTRTDAFGAWTSIRSLQLPAAARRRRQRVLARCEHRPAKVEGSLYIWEVRPKQGRAADGSALRRVRAAQVEEAESAHAKAMTKPRVLGTPHAAEWRRARCWVDAARDCGRAREDVRLEPRKRGTSGHRRLPRECIARVHCDGAARTLRRLNRQEQRRWRRWRRRSRSTTGELGRASSSVRRLRVSARASHRHSVRRTRRRLIRLLHRVTMHSRHQVPFAGHTCPVKEEEAEEKSERGRRSGHRRGFRGICRRSFAGCSVRR